MSRATRSITADRGFEQEAGRHATTVLAGAEWISFPSWPLRSRKPVAELELEMDFAAPEALWRSLFARPGKVRNGTVDPIRARRTI